MTRRRTHLAVISLLLSVCRCNRRQIIGASAPTEPNQNNAVSDSDCYYYYYYYYYYHVLSLLLPVLLPTTFSSYPHQQQ